MPPPSSPSGTVPLPAPAPHTWWQENDQGEAAAGPWPHAYPAYPHVRQGPDGVAASTMVHKTGQTRLGASPLLPPLPTHPPLRLQMPMLAAPITGFAAAGDGPAAPPAAAILPAPTAFLPAPAAVVAWLWAPATPQPQRRVPLESWLHLQQGAGPWAASVALVQRSFAPISHGNADKLCRFLVARAHAERAEPLACRLSLESSLTRFFALERTGQPTERIARMPQAPHLLVLSAPHYDGCLFDPSRRVGQGGQGVFFVGLTKRGQAVAVKGLGYRQTPTAHQRASLRREAQALRKSQQFDYLQLIQGQQFLYMVMPLFDGDLSQHAGPFLALRASARTEAFLNMVHGATAPGVLRGARYVLQQILQGLLHLHEQALLLHQDIKPANIFLQQTRRRFVLGDYGLSVDNDHAATVRGRSAVFAAPEQWPGGPPLTAKADIFAVGTTMFYLLTAHNHSVRQARALLLDRPPHLPELPGLFPPQLHGDTPLLHRLHRAYQSSGACAPAALAAGAHGGFRTSEGEAVQTAARAQHHFHAVHLAIAHVDPQLAALLTHMVRYDPEQRPTARAALAALEETNAQPLLSAAQLNHVWHEDNLQWAPEVQGSLTALGRLLPLLQRTNYRDTP